MNNEHSKLTTIIAFVKQNKIIIVAVALLFLFIYTVYLSIATLPQDNPITNTTNSPMQPSSAVTRLTVTPATSKQVNLYEPSITWTPVRFSEDDLRGVDFTESRLPDSSVKYSYESTNPNRPNEIIVKNNIIIYQRSIINSKYIFHYTNTMGAPDYVFQSSRFYGGNTMTYVYLEEGTAFVADAKTTLVKEQLSFQPTSLEDFKQKYAQDIADFTIIPTVAEEQGVVPPDQEQ